MGWGWLASCCFDSGFGWLLLHVVVWVFGSWFLVWFLISVLAEYLDLHSGLLIWIALFGLLCLFCCDNC